MRSSYLLGLSIFSLKRSCIGSFPACYSQQGGFNNRINLAKFMRIMNL